MLNEIQKHILEVVSGMANGNVAARGDADEIYPQLMGMTIAGCNMLEVDQKC